jgi:predicted transcriptional regulator
MILSVLNNERRCTVERIVELTNLGENKIRSAIEFMIESGLVEASGKGKNRTCMLGKRIEPEHYQEETEKAWIASLEKGFIVRIKKQYSMFDRQT